MHSPDVVSFRLPQPEDKHFIDCLEASSTIPTCLRWKTGNKSALVGFRDGRFYLGPIRIREGEHQAHGDFGILIFEINKVAHTYIGSFRKGKIHGQGTLFSFTGKKAYHGSFDTGFNDKTEGIAAIAGERFFKVLQSKAAGEIELPKKSIKRLTDPTPQDRIAHFPQLNEGPIVYDNDKRFFHGTLDRTGKASGEGTLNTLTHIFSGSFIKGLMSGFGMCLTKKTQEVYIGAFKEGQRHGLGLLAVPDKGYFFGRFTNDEWDDEDGVWLDPEGEQFATIDFAKIGEIEDFETPEDMPVRKESYLGTLNEEKIPHGQGILTWSNGVRYKGSFEEGQMHGEGKLFFSAGKIKILVGTWSQDKPHAPEHYMRGTILYRDGSVHTGSFLLDSRELPGKTIYPLRNQDDPYPTMYEGDWAQDKYHGKGILTFSNGQVYEGYFKNGLQHGRGKLTYSESSPILKLNGIATQILSFETEWKEDKPVFGKGIWTFRSGRRINVETSEQKDASPVTTDEDTEELSDDSPASVPPLPPTPKESVLDKRKRLVKKTAQIFRNPGPSSKQE